MKAEELKEQLQKNGDIQILDVREKEEFEQGEKMRGAENVPMGRVFLEAAKGRLPKDKKIVTVCASGARCEIVARELRQKGYDIEYLEGGLAAWKRVSAVMILAEPHDERAEVGCWLRSRGMRFASLVIEQIN